MRTYGKRTHDAMPELIKRICVHTAAALGAEAELTEYTVAHPAVVNDERAAARCRRAVKRVLGPEAVGSYRGTLSGEDFSLFLERVPGVLAFVGVRNPAVGATFCPALVLLSRRRVGARPRHGTRLPICRGLPYREMTAADQR